jgi:hypothetical protein
MVIVLEAQVALTPAGKPFAPETPEFEIPVAPVMVWVIFVKAEPMHKVGLEEAAPAVLTAETVMVPVAFTVPQPPVSGII